MSLKPIDPDADIADVLALPASSQSGVGGQYLAWIVGLYNLYRLNT